MNNPHDEAWREQIRKRISVVVNARMHEEDLDAKDLGFRLSDDERIVDTTAANWVRHIKSGKASERYTVKRESAASGNFTRLELKYISCVLSYLEPIDETIVNDLREAFPKEFHYPPIHKGPRLRDFF